MFDFPEKILLVFALPKIFKQGTSGIEPPSSESAVELQSNALPLSYAPRKQRL